MTNILAGIIDKFRKRAPAQPQSGKRSVGFAAADYNRLTSGMNAYSTHIAAIMRMQGRALRARSRQVIDNNPYGAKFAAMAVNNICGPDPFRLQAKMKSSRGNMDTYSNSKVESEWAWWGRPGNCELTGRMSWADLQRLVVRTLVSDGEVLLRILEGEQYGPWGINLQLIDSNRLDEDRNQDLGGGRAICTGVEMDPIGRPVAYHVLKSPPNMWQYGQISREYIRIPAEQIIHIYIPHRAEQVRGVPWMFAALMTLHQLGYFEEAAVFAARIGASKMGFFEKTSPEARYKGEEDERTSAVTMDAEPGEFEELPWGLQFKEFNPNFPSEAVGPFIKSCLRGVASGIGVSYHSFANDLESVNFSSARAGMLEERDNWMTIQSWLIEHLHMPVYERWLQMSNLTGRLPLQGPMVKYFDVIWQPKRWQWIDPLKDVQANIESIQWGLKSRTQIVNETGGDLEDVLDQLANENRQAKDKKVEIQPGKAEAAANKLKDDKNGQPTGGKDGGGDGGDDGQEDDPQL